MDEKELKKRIKNSFKSGMNRAQITRNLQKSKGYKLEYIDAMVKKAKPRGKLFYISIFVIFFLLLISGILTYLLFFQTNAKQEIQNPLQEMKDSDIFSVLQQANLDKIEITPEFISYLLNEINAYELHKNPLTFEKPIINFDISGQKFYSVISKGKIQTSEGSDSQADLEFLTTKPILIQAILDENPAEIFKQSVQDGNIQIETLVSEAELFAKGYLGLYRELRG